MTRLEIQRLQFIIMDLHWVIEDSLAYDNLTWRYAIDMDGERVIWEQGNFTAQLSWSRLSEGGKWSWSLSMDNRLDRWVSSGDDIFGEDAISLPVDNLKPLALRVENESIEDIRNHRWQGPPSDLQLLFAELAETAWEGLL